MSNNHNKHSLASIFTMHSDWSGRIAELARRHKAERKFLHTVSLVCSLGGLLFGYNTGVINGAISFIETDFHLRPTLVGLVPGSLLIGAAFGAFLGGHLSDKFGRYRVTLINSLLFVIATVASSVAPSFEIMLISRIFLGLAVGCASATVPVYLAEIAPAEKRGQMVTRNELMCVVGQLIAFLTNAILGTIWVNSPHIWRWMIALGLIPSVGLLLGTWIVVPESPRWLITSDRYDQALKILTGIRTSEEQAKAELEEVQQLVIEDRKMHKHVSFGQLMSESWVRHCILIGLGIALCQQVTGVNSVMFYGTEILRESGLSNQAALLANIANGVISVLATFAGIWLLGRTSRRHMLIVAQCGTVVVHCMIGVCALLVPAGPIKGLLILALCVVFLAFQQGSISPVTWLLLAEIFPLRIRGIAISVTIFVLWLMMCTMGVLFPILAACIGIAGTFFAFSAVNVFAALFSLVWLPETRAKSLEALEQQFKAKDWARLKMPGNFTGAADDAEAEGAKKCVKYGSTRASGDSQTQM